MAQQSSTTVYDTIKFADQLTPAEFALSANPETAMPVEAWLRLPDQTVIDCEYADKIRFHLCDDESCDTDRRVRARLHVNLATRIFCPVHQTVVAQLGDDGRGGPARYACPSGHGWRVADTTPGSRERLIVENA